MDWQCIDCQKPVPQERAQFLNQTGRRITCINCSTEQGVVGFQVFPHKTGSTCIVVRGEDEETLRIARRADKRAR